MDLTKYINIINDVGSKIESGELKQENISTYLKEQYGWSSSNSSISWNNYLENWENEKKETQFRRDTLYIRKNILDIISSMNEIEKNTNPFTIRFNSKKLAKLFEENEFHKTLSEYKKVLKDTVDFINDARGDLNFTKEHYKILK